LENNKKIYKYFCDTFLYDAQKNHESAINKFYKKDAIINIVEPINEIKGSEELIKKFFLPMLYAFPDFYRRTDILFGGIINEEEWVTGSGHYVGTFAKDWMGIPANNKLTYLRYGEFHRMQNGQAVETYLFFDLIDLLRQIGKWPLLTKSLGMKILFLVQ